MVRRIFADRAAGITVREIIRRLAADAIPSPTGKPIWGTSTLSRLLRNEAYIGRVYFNRTEAVPDPRPSRRNRQVPRDREDWIAIAAPASSPTRPSRPPAASPPTTASGARAAPNPASGCCTAWSNAVSAESAPTATRCAAATAPGTATTTAATTTRSAPAAKTGAAPNATSAPTRSTRSCSTRSAPRSCTPTLLAGEQAVALPTPTPDDELLAAELARLDRKIDAADAERRRLIDLYQAGLIELPELQRRASEVEHRRKSSAQATSLTAQRPRSPATTSSAAASTTSPPASSP